MPKLLTNGYEIEITEREADTIRNSYEKDTKFFKIGNFTLFRGAITNAVIIPDGEKRVSEKKEQEKYFQNIMKDYLNAPADVKKDIRDNNPDFAEWLNPQNKSITNI